MTQKTKGIIVWIISVAITFVVVALILWPLVAKAQDGDLLRRQQWIHDNAKDCCDHRDCAPANVSMTFTGWKIAGADNVVPFAAVVRWSFGVPYACIINRYARCLFMGAGG